MSLGDEGIRIRCNWHLVFARDADAYAKDSHSSQFLKPYTHRITRLHSITGGDFYDVTAKT